MAIRSDRNRPYRPGRLLRKALYHVLLREGLAVGRASFSTLRTAGRAAATCAGALAILAMVERA